MAVRVNDLWLLLDLTVWRLPAPILNASCSDLCRVRSWCCNCLQRGSITLCSSSLTCFSYCFLQSTQSKLLCLSQCLLCLSHFVVEACCLLIIRLNAAHVSVSLLCWLLVSIRLDSGVCDLSELIHSLPHFISASVHCIKHKTNRCSWCLSKACGEKYCLVLNGPIITWPDSS